MKLRLLGSGRILVAIAYSTVGFWLGSVWKLTTSESARLFVVKRHFENSFIMALLQAKPEYLYILRYLAMKEVEYVLE